MVNSDLQQPALPHGWVSQWSARHQRYFYVDTTSDDPHSSWEHPGSSLAAEATPYPSSSGLYDSLQQSNPYSDASQFYDNYATANPALSQGALWGTGQQEYQELPPAIPESTRPRHAANLGAVDPSHYQSLQSALDDMLQADSSHHPYLQKTPPYSSQQHHRSRVEMTPEPIPLASLSDPYAASHDSIYLSPQMRPSYPPSRQYEDASGFDSNPYSYQDEMLQPSPPYHQYDAYGQANGQGHYQNPFESTAYGTSKEAAYPTGFPVNYGY